MRLRLQDWASFRQTIYQIYDHRVQDAALELIGGVNTTHVALDEHLLLYMSRLPDQGKQGGMLALNSNPLKGSEVQQKLLNFLYSLKYYSTRWMRAKLYAQLAGFLQEKSSIGGPITQHGLQNFENNT